MGIQQILNTRNSITGRVNVQPSLHYQPAVLGDTTISSFVLEGNCTSHTSHYHVQAKLKVACVDGMIFLSEMYSVQFHSPSKSLSWIVKSLKTFLDSK
jgi:hypothetical protein